MTNWWNEIQQQPYKRESYVWMIQISIRDVALRLVPLLEITGTLDQSADAALYSWLCFHVTTLTFVVHQSKTGPTAAPQIQTKGKQLWLQFLETWWFQVKVKEHFLSNHRFMCRETSHKCVHEYRFTASLFISKSINANRTTINNNPLTQLSPNCIHYARVVLWCVSVCAYLQDVTRINLCDYN